jgi:hypothetical protein
MGALADKGEIRMELSLNKIKENHLFKIIDLVSSVVLLVVSMAIIAVTLSEVVAVGKYDIGMLANVWQWYSTFTNIMVLLGILLYVTSIVIPSLLKPKVKSYYDDVILSHVKAFNLNSIAALLVMAILIIAVSSGAFRDSLFVVIVGCIAFFIIAFPVLIRILSSIRDMLKMFYLTIKDNRASA